ncbi:hypothetical protein [Microvirga yunnanensis]|uniref:hypothetical protein n=1 Tax=Microvirga yunnanensis TaxID=2953740 RepID=UPI0021C5D743|nr:hypothetical protein [Microvirga sp. HBU65207]
MQLLPIFASSLERLGSAPLMERTLELGMGVPRILNVRLGCGLAGSDEGAQLYTNLDHYFPSGLMGE